MRVQFAGQGDEAAGQRFAGEVDAAEMRPFGALPPAGRELFGVEMQVSAVVADEEVAGRVGLVGTMASSGEWPVRCRKRRSIPARSLADQSASCRNSTG